MSTDVLDLVPEHLRMMGGYEPIEPIDVLAQKLNLPEDQIAKLDANENPYGPSPRLCEELARFPYYHIYPDPEHRKVREALGEHLGLDPDHIVCGSGADELLDVVSRLFIKPGDRTVTAIPTFGMYSFLTELCGGHLIRIPRQADFSLDVEGMLATAKEGAKLIFLASPNNPTGNPVTAQELELLLAQGFVVVVDEAYAEFAGETFMNLVPEHENLMVIRTFSKWAGLAGLRAGFGVFPKALAPLVLKVKMPYNLNVAAQVAILASLADYDILQERVRAIVAERERLFEKLKTVPWLASWPSQANFLLCEVKGLDAHMVWSNLRRQGILVRYYDTPALRHYLRITVGKPEHTDRLLAALQEIGAGLGK